MFSVDGLVSGLDTTAIIEGSLSIQQRRIDRLSLQKQDILDEQAAFKSMEAQLLSLQGSMSGILRSTNNAFDQYSATSSDEDLLIASTKSDATAGTYRFRTMQLAQAQQLKSNGLPAEPTRSTRARWKFASATALWPTSRSVTTTTPFRA